MVKGGSGKRAEIEEVDLDGWGELGEAITALREASWRLGMASYKLEEDGVAPSTATPSVRHAMEVGACVALAEALATQVEAIASQARKLRKRAREV